MGSGDATSLKSTLLRGGKKVKLKSMHTACSRVYEILGMGQKARGDWEGDGQGVFRTSSGGSAQLPKAAVGTPEVASY